MSEPEPPLDALALISSDLDAGRRRRRAHFLPALLIAAVVVIAAMAVIGVRPDLLEQPPAQLALLAGLWVLCLVVFPAIGVGLLFVSRPTRIALVVLATVGTLFAVTQWPLGASPSLGQHVHEEVGIDGCFGVTAVSGIAVLAVGFVSGAFVQRRGLSAVFWVASGVAMVALNIVTWHCPGTGLFHVLPNHMGAALGLLAAAVVIGLVARRTQT
jgi:hypothetical protein